MSALGPLNARMLRRSVLAVSLLALVSLVTACGIVPTLIAHAPATVSAHVPAAVSQGATQDGGAVPPPAHARFRARIWGLRRAREASASAVSTRTVLLARIRAHLAPPWWLLSQGTISVRSRPAEWCK